MHAGSGIVHSERTGPELHAAQTRIEGIQLWVALPKAEEETLPEFGHYPEDTLPLWEGPGLKARILAGTAFGLRSPVKTTSNTLYVDAALESGGELSVPDAEERAVYVASGSVSVNGDQFEEAQMLVLRPDSEAVLTANEACRLLVLGGDAIDGERYMLELRVQLKGADRSRKTELAGKSFSPGSGRRIRTHTPPG